MKFNQFDVVELKNKDMATILGINGNKYKVEIINNKGTRKEFAEIREYDISSIIYKKYL